MADEEFNGEPESDEKDENKDSTRALLVEILEKPVPVVEDSKDDDEYIDLGITKEEIEEDN